MSLLDWSRCGGARIKEFSNSITYVKEEWNKKLRGKICPPVGQAAVAWRFVLNLVCPETARMNRNFDKIIQFPVIAVCRWRSKDYDIIIACQRFGSLEHHNYAEL